MNKDPPEKFGGFFFGGDGATELSSSSNRNTRMTRRTLPDITDAAAVLTAFDEAKRAGRPSVECYKAAVDAWQLLYPDQHPEYAAKQAVAVVLGARGADMMAVK